MTHKPTLAKKGTPVKIENWNSVIVRNRLKNAPELFARWLERSQIDEEKEALFARMCQYVEDHARFDELMRIRAATLDWREDVWSVMDDGTMVSLETRLNNLYGRQ